MESLVCLHGKMLMLVLTFELVLSKAQHGPGFLGCFRDDTSDRALGSNPVTSYDQSVERCFKQCLDWLNVEYKYAGLEYGWECFCGNNEDYGRYGEKPRECKDPCLGNADQLCGDSFRISIYEIAQGVCPNTVDPANGKHSITNPQGLSYNLDNYKFFGTTAHFYCDTGFLLQGANTIICVKTENTVLWSDNVPTCESQRTTSSSTTTPLPVTTMEMATTLTSLPVSTMTLTTTSTYLTPGIPEITEEATANHDTGEPSPTTAEVTTVKATALIPPPSTGNLYAGQIAGIALAVVLGVTIASLFIVVIFVWRRKRTESTFTNSTYGYPDDAHAKDSPDSQTYHSPVILRKPSIDEVVYATPDDVNVTPDDASVSACNVRPTKVTESSSNGQSDTEWVDNTLYTCSKLQTLEMDTNGDDGWVDNTIYE